MAGMDLLEIPGVTDGLDNDYAAQARLALDALQRYDVVIVHVEAPDEAGHAGSAADKIVAIEQIDSAMVSQMLKRGRSDFRVLVTADHPTPVPVRTHTSDPVPCVLWGDGLGSNGASRLTEAEARRTSLLIDPGYLVMRRLIGE
jgi:2,3-bisphosphoglycerate-independent phosphoglycerate mutase